MFHSSAPVPVQMFVWVEHVATFVVTRHIDDAASHTQHRVYPLYARQNKAVGTVDTMQLEIKMNGRERCVINENACLNASLQKAHLQA